MSAFWYLSKLTGISDNLLKMGYKIISQVAARKSSRHRGRCLVFTFVTPASAWWKHFFDRFDRIFVQIICSCIKQSNINNSKFYWHNALDESMMHIVTCRRKKWIHKKVRFFPLLRNSNMFVGFAFQWVPMNYINKPAQSLKLCEEHWSTLSASHDYSGRIWWIQCSNPG